MSMVSVESHGLETCRAAHQGRAGITTTLFHLLAAMQEDVPPEEDAWLVATIVHWIQSGRLTWQNGPSASVRGEEDTPWMSSSPW